ncbi:flagellin [Sporosarcina trichiuri]|uniref:flagellin N-terminal helical domain-containing protein n=1 Tax=Sporosarcina trichiuri TaxID=3056445 RepID=UPI0032AF28B3
MLIIRTSNAGLVSHLLHTIHRQTVNYQKSNRKISSGMKVTQAADDAAGLAISEKMRGQIRGLAQADRNIQDGVSLVQVAEGGLADIHSYLQRVRELSVQAANDVLTSADRQEIQREVSQLIAGVDQIANHTTFNTIQLLNVEMKQSYYDKYFDQVVGVPEIPPVEGIDPPFLPMQWYHVSKEEIGFMPQGNHQAIATNGSSAVIAGSWSDFLVFDSSKPEGEQWSKEVTMTGLDGQLVSHDYQNFFHDVFWDGRQYVAMKEKGAVFTSSDGHQWQQKLSDMTGPDYKVKLQSITSNGNSYIAVGWKEFGAIGNNLRIEQVMYRSADGQEWEEVSVPPYASSASRLNDVLWNAERNEFIAVGTNGLVARSSDGMQWERNFHIGGGFGSFTGITYSDGKYVAVTGDGTHAKIFYSEDGTSWSDDVQPIGPSLSARRYNGVQKTGDYFIALGTETIGHAISKDGVNWMRVPSNNWNGYLKDSVQVGDTIIAVGNGQSRNTGIFILGPRDKNDTDSEEGENGSGNSSGESHGSHDPQDLLLQVGPNAGNTFRVELSDVRASSMRIDNVSVLTRENANEALLKLDKAIGIVSDQRTKYGAYDNALNHISNNVQNYGENITTAESRIRDTDMAKELLLSIKSSLLLQTNQTVMGHSKVMAESVLQLLK